jgi:cytochrome c oxidase assembly protein subunit 15
VRVRGQSTALGRVALASLVANITIVVTGGAVRLTDSGLGCPTWPSCTEDSYTPTAAMGVHGLIEYGNRLFTVVVALVALAGLVLARRHRPRRRALTRPALLVLLGIPTQGLVGGLTVLTDLNPWVVACHFLVSMGIIAAAYMFWAATREIDRPTTGTAPAVPRRLRPLVVLIAVVSGAVLVAGTVVTGSGPHAGDLDARRTGLDPAAVSRVHADLVLVLIGLVVAAWFALRAVGATAAAVRARWLGGVILAQGLVGLVQYVTGLPEVLVGAHMLGACLVWLATVVLLRSTRDSPVATPDPSEPDPLGPAAVPDRAPVPSARA